jgi:hypothetical protein
VSCFFYKVRRERSLALFLTQKKLRRKIYDFLEPSAAQQGVKQETKNSFHFRIFAKQKQSKNETEVHH